LKPKKSFSFFSNSGCHKLILFGNQELQPPWSQHTTDGDKSWIRKSESRSFYWLWWE